jgi:hypothetical protein
MLTFPATSGQEWYFQAAHNGLCNDNVDMAWRLRGPLCRDTLQAAVDELVRRHASLRTTLVQRDGCVFQQIHDPVALPIEDADASNARAVAALATEPFMVRGGPLVRARLCELSPDEHLFVLVSHHTVSDGWSAALVHRDLVEFHRALREQRSPKLPSLPIHMGDYAVWEQRATRVDVGAYWRERLSLGHPRLRLGLGASADDRPADVRTLMLPDLSSGAAERLENLSSAHGTTLPRVLGAGVIAAMTPYADRELTVSVVTANRGRSQLVDVVGNLAEQIPVRVSLPPGQTFAELVDAFNNGVAGAYDHPFAPQALRQAIRQNPERHAGPVYDLEVNWLGRPAAYYPLGPQSDDLSVAEMDVPADQMRHQFDDWVDRLPLVGFVHQPGLDGTIKGLLLVNVTALPLPDAQRLGDRVTAVIEHISLHPETRLDHLARVIK